MGSRKLNCYVAQRALIARALKRLETSISICVVHPDLNRKEGWKFSNVTDEEYVEGCTVDPYGSTHLRQVYERDETYQGRNTVPLLGIRV